LHQFFHPNQQQHGRRQPYVLLSSIDQLMHFCFALVLYLGGLATSTVTLGGYLVDVAVPGRPPVASLLLLFLAFLNVSLS
jgi:hypothetical protein